MGGYEHFISQLDLFLKRYYLDKAFKGLLVFLGILLVFILLLGFLQLVSFFSGPVRAGLFYVSLVILSLAALLLVVRPFCQSRNWVHRMSYKEAARYLAKEYPQLGDRLCNVLELKASASCNDNGVPAALLEAAIRQITSGFLSYRFEKAVKFRHALPYLYAFVFLVFLFAFILLAEPRVLKSTVQVVRYSEEFPPEFPFEISLADTSLHVAYGEDFPLEVRVSGQHLPREIFLVQDGFRIPLERRSSSCFGHVFRQVRRNEVFFLEAGRYRSPLYTIEVDYRPLLSSMKAVLRYPAYTGKSPQVVTDNLDFQVPFGTRIAWELRFDHARTLSAVAVPAQEGGLRVFDVDTAQRPVFRFETQVFSSFEYLLLASSYREASPDTLAFAVECVADAYPRLQVRAFFDSLHPLQRYYQGMISDDYGFHRLFFVARCTNARTGSSWQEIDTLPIEPSRTVQPFTYYLDLARFPLQEGDEVSFGFELSDNDPYYPYKKAYSPLEMYRKPTREQVRGQLESTASSIDRNFSISLQQSRSFEKRLQDFIEGLLTKQQFSWQDRRQVELLVEEQRRMRQQYEQLADELRKKQELEAQAGVDDPDLEEKQRQLQALLENLLDDRILESLQELQSLLDQQAGQEKALELLEEIRFEKNRARQELEQNMNLYRQMEFEMRMERLLGDAEELVEKSGQLKEELASQDNKELARNTDSLQDRLAGLETDLESLQGDMETLRELDARLEKPNGFRLPDSLLDALRQSMGTTRKALQENNARGSRQSHEQTHGQMQQLLDGLRMQKQQIEEANAAEDAAFIRLLLKGVLRVSIEQEDLMTRLGETRVNDPRYADLIRRQSALNLEIGFVADSVRAISRRQPQVALSTRQTLRDLEKNSAESLEYLLGMNNVYHQRYSVANSWALARQQYSMTALNDLALLLSESLDRMRPSLQMKGQASGSFQQEGNPQPAPGSGKDGKGEKMPSMMFPGKEQGQSLSQMQEALNRQIEALKKMLEQQAAQPGMDSSPASSSRKEGPSGTPAGSSVSGEQVSEAFARAAARQEMIRRMLQEELARQKAMDPSSAGKYNSILGDMERTERDLVNRVLNSQLLARQKKIETRMLEAENAELQREKDDRRESRRGQAFDPALFDSVSEFDRKERSARELLLRRIPELRPYYKERLQDFLFGEP